MEAPDIDSPFLVEWPNYLIDEVEYPGVTSTVKGIVSYKSTDTNWLANNGFISNYNADKKSFYACGTLAHLGLGFFDDVKIPIYKGGFVISFIRDTDDCTVHRWKTMKKDGSLDVLDSSSLPDVGKIVINEFIIRVPMIEFKPRSKIMLVKELTDLQNVQFHFKNWQCIQKPGLSGNTFTFDVTNIFRNVQNPTFVMVAFQTGAQDQERDSSLFNSLNVKNIRVKINDNVYPEELLNLNIAEGNYSLAYEMYKDYKNVYSDNNDMLYDPSDFINKKCVYVIDTSKQVENISNSKSNIIINVDFAANVPNNTIMYVIILSHTILSYDIMNNIIKENQ